MIPLLSSVSMINFCLYCLPSGISCSVEHSLLFRSRMVAVSSILRIASNNFLYFFCNFVVELSFLPKKLDSGGCCVFLVDKCYLVGVINLAFHH